MIILPEVAKKLETVLNGYATNYQFMVATQGFHLESIADTETGKNFIPVFISSIGGQINPVPNLKQAQYNIRVQMFFPVRFKDDIFSLCDSLYDSFVGTIMSYGDVSGNALSNISIPTFAELQNIDLNEFKSWVGNTYQKTVDIMETYMSMEFTLYLSTLGNGLAFGNEVSTKLTYSYFIDSPYIEVETTALTSFEKYYRYDIEDDTGYYAWKSETGTIVFTNTTSPTTSSVVYRKVLNNYVAWSGRQISSTGQNFTVEETENDPIFDDGSMQSQSEGDGQQVLGDTTTEIESGVQTTSYGSGFSVYLKENEFYKTLIRKYFAGEIQQVSFNIEYKLFNITYRRKCYLQSTNLLFPKGQPIRMVFAFAKKVDL